jgi:hypothetical protein
MLASTFLLVVHLCTAKSSPAAAAAVAALYRVLCRAPDRFVAPTYQVLFANMVALVWNVYFSFATRPKAA